MSPTSLQKTIAEHPPIVVEERFDVSKSATASLRRKHCLPAIACGGGQGHLHLSLSPSSVKLLLRMPHPVSVPFELELEKKRLPVILRQAQRDPVNEKLVHVDFLLLSKGSVITTKVPIDFINREQSPGLKRGGLLNIVRWHVELICPAFAIPKSIPVDLASLDIGDSVHINSVTFSKGISLSLQGRNFTLATIVSPASLSSQGARTSGEEATEAKEATEEDSTIEETSKKKEESEKKGSS